MGKFKGILKKISGGLKMAIVAAPFVLGLSGLLVGVGGAISAAVYHDKAFKYIETEEFLERKLEDVNKNQFALKNGEISAKEYTQNEKYFETKEYILKVLKESESEESKIYQGYIDKNHTSVTVAFSGLGAVGAAFLIGMPLRFTGASQRIIMSALNDSAEGDEEFYDAKIKKDPFYDENEEELPDIEQDYYNK